MKFKKPPTLWGWMLLCSLTLQNCASCKPSSSELQQRNITIASNAQKISDADAAVAAYDMLTNCEKSLADTTLALQQTRISAKKQTRKAKKDGILLGALGGMIGFMIYSIFR
jgi:hypothetical protein